MLWSVKQEQNYLKGVAKKNKHLMKCFQIELGPEG